MQTNLRTEGTGNPFDGAPIIYSYTRAQALADGEQIDVSDMAKEAGIIFPVFVTRAVWDAYVKVPDGVQGQDEKGRLWDIVFMLHVAIRRCSHGDESLDFELYVRNNNRSAKLVKLRSACGPMDMNDPVPAITVMIPGED